MALTYQGSRRDFIRESAIATGGLLAAGLTLRTAAAQAPPSRAAASNEAEGEGVSPAEDLMREHGVLNRVLLIYDEAVRRIDAKAELPPEPLAKAAALIRRFVEDYHEKLEEDHLFPRFEKAGKLVELVTVLRAQHAAGRRLTDDIRQRATAGALQNPDESRELADALRAFIRMYRPHEAREDTVLFPALHTIVTPREYDALGDEFEDREHALFGADGFESMVSEVASIEKTLGLYDLAQFTPRA